MKAVLAVALLCVLPCTVAAQNAAVEDLQVTFSLVPQGRGGTPSGTLLLTPKGGAGGERRVAVGDRAVLTRLEPESAWRVELHSEEWWMEPVDVTASSAGTNVSLSVWPLTTFSGRLIGNGAAPLPSSVSVIVEAAPWRETENQIARGITFQCPVLRPAGTWSCRLPRARLDLAIVAAGFIPEYRWGVDLTARGSFDAGPVVLREGGSLVAWLVPDSRRTGEKKATATLRREVARDPSPAARQLAAPVAEAMVEANGFIQLAPVPEGRYVLEVKAPGSAIERIYPVQVFHRRESALRRPIQLSDPIALSVAVSPPLDPFGAPWTAVVRRAGDFAAGYDAQPMFRGAVPPTGELAIEDMSPGRFAVTVLDAAANAIAEEEFDVRSAGGARLAVTIDVVHVRGKVVHRDSPVAATLVFGGEHGVTSVAMRSDESGTFTGWLPRAGKWVVDVRNGEGLSTAVNAVVADGRELLIDIPSTSIRGRVMDAQGPVADAQVLATAPGGVFVKTISDDDGTFELSGLGTGSYSIGARSLKTGESSEFVSVELSEKDSAREGISLELRSRSTIGGTVLDNGAAVVGAQVHVFAFGVGSQTGGSAVTDVNGKFTVAVPSGASRALFVVQAPARALRAFDRTFDADLRFNVEARGGSIELVLPPEHVGWALFQDGVPLPAPVVLDWARGHGALVRPGVPVPIADVAVAHYRFCARLADGTAPCAEGQVVPGGTLRLQLAE
ncbi:MAG TPA: carboxypeptidase regulatory-like domain-containing protein [Thermoanaerobaculia bacterium]|nr:carboxypeptidase regulatory-like domain-containing protein [Thermoanaerobaculia bacterium]